MQFSIGSKAIGGPTITSDSLNSKNGDQAIFYTYQDSDEFDNSDERNFENIDSK